MSPRLFSLLLFIAAVSVQAQEAVRAVPTARATRVQTPPALDGRDNDAAWALAAPFTEFRQFQPADNGEPTFRTEARAVYDNRHLYVLVRAFDPHPDSLLRLLSRRDVRTNSDQLKIIIDGYKDRRNAIELMVNPAGVKRDASIYSDYIEDMTWDGVWDVAVGIDSLGWFAEFAVPFSQFRFNPGQQAFGFGIWRDVARLNERVAWPAYSMQAQTLVSQLGTMEGFEGLSRGSRAEILPYLVTKNVTEARADGWHHPQKATVGLDVKLGLGSNLTLDATVNPDFGQVEADPAVLNLTAFEIRFEERRPFFQEGIGLFRCGGPCEGIFYTRRIGRAPQLRGSAADPASTPILGAAKLTGRLSRGLSIGLVEAVTGRQAGVGERTIEPRTNYLVARAVQELRGGRSSFGVMGTAVNRELDAETSPLLRRDAFSIVAQGFHRFANDTWEAMMYTGRALVRGSEQAIARTQLSSTHLFQRPDHEEDFDPTRTSMTGGVIGGSLTKLRGQWRYDTFLRAAGAGMELNDLGFVPVVNDLSVRQTLSFQTQGPNRWQRRSFAFIQTEQHWTTGGLPAGNSVISGTTVELPSFWSVSVHHVLTNIGRAHCIPCARGGPAVRQSLGNDIMLNVSGDPRGAIVPEFAAATGVGDEGNSWGWSVSGGAEVRVASRFSMGATTEFVNRRDHKQWLANFGAPTSDTTHYTFARLRQKQLTLTMRANFTATPTLSFQYYGQPFITTGDFSNWRELGDPRAKRYDDRYRPFGAGQDPDGFNVKQFNSNTVVRWEYRPGSALFVVWQQGRAQDDRNPGHFRLGRDYRDLFRAHPDNTLLLKASWWFNP